MKLEKTKEDLRHVREELAAVKRERDLIRGLEIMERNRYTELCNRLTSCFGDSDPCEFAERLEAERDEYRRQVEEWKQVGPFTLRFERERDDLRRKVARLPAIVAEVRELEETLLRVRAELSQVTAERDLAISKPERQPCSGVGDDWCGDCVGDEDGGWDGCAKP